MQYRRLGSSGLQLSALSFGAWMTFGAQIGRSEARNLIAAAWDNGINFFDNAETYANGEAERVMGDVIADLRLPRDGYCVSSKVFFGAVDEPRPTQRGLSRKHVHDACHAALKRLRVDYLDLYFCHRPDPDTPIEETVWAMDALIRQGKVLYWGTSEWSAAQIREAHEDRARASPACADDGAAAVQPAAPRARRTRIRAAVRRTRPGHHDLVAAGVGPADRQVQRRRAGECAAGPRRTMPGCSACVIGDEGAGASSARGASPRWPTSWAWRPRRWRSPGACAIRTSPR